MKVLVTGGAGYIGSTISSALLDAGHTPVILDDFSTGHRSFVTNRIWYRGDVADPAVLRRIVADHPDIEAAVHCAAHIIAPESVAKPLRYYDNNVSKSITLLEQLSELGIRRVLFSSSASIYAPGQDFTVDETSAVAPGSPYAACKWMVERVLEDACHAGLVRGLSLRYFNPIGADPMRRSGPHLNQPSHALGRIMDAGRDGVPFTVTGVDWPTSDGSGLRDYIHVWDLAQAHVRALEHFDHAVDPVSGYDAINIGTGRGTTVFELVRAYERVSGRPLDVREGPSRPGDVAGSYTRNDKAALVLGWQAERTVDDAIRDALDWAELGTPALVAV